jgi:uncharacterized repeat protein (TIGR03803 family)
VFELAKTVDGYASNPTTLVTFDTANGGAHHQLMIDSAGNIFGTTGGVYHNAPLGGGRTDGATAFEIVNTSNGYASTPTILEAFPENTVPGGGLAMDAAGDLFGTTGGTPFSTGGFIFEMAKTTDGYAAPQTLYTFSGQPTIQGTLIVDGAGNLFGTTTNGGDGNGTTFELAKTANGYASTLTTLHTFEFNGGMGGVIPAGRLLADASGNLFGATTGATFYNNGTVYEISNSGFVPISGGGGGGGPTLTTLASLNDTNGSDPEAPLLLDATGNLFGTTRTGGTNFRGTVFEVMKTAGGYADTPTTLINFDGSAALPTTGLIADSAGNLFGTTLAGGSGTGQMHDLGGGTVFEVVKTASGYASTPTIVAGDFNGSFNGRTGDTPQELIMDADGNLFGTSGGGANGAGTFFEIPKTASGYESTHTVLFNFNGTNGQAPSGPLIADSTGNLFGVTGSGGISNNGTVFEIMKTAGGYADAPTTLASFSGGAGGLIPSDGLVADAAGNLFGVTSWGGFSDAQRSGGYGTVFEIAKTDSGYSSTPIILASFHGSDGARPIGGLIVDAAGNLFGTTAEGGTSSNGTVFEIMKTTSSYDSTPIALVNFNGSNGDFPEASLTVDSTGNLFGTTAFGGANNNGTVFELTGTGFVTSSGGGGGGTGQTFTANDTAGQTLSGGSGDDIFYAGHNSVVMTGDGGADKFVFQYLPWNAGHTTDFTPGTDKLDLHALFAASGYAGTDPIADGYLQFQSDGQGGTQVLFDPDGPGSGNPWPFLITTLDHVDPSNLHNGDWFM